MTQGFKHQKAFTFQKSSTIKLRRLYVHHANKALNLESTKVTTTQLLKKQTTYLVYINGRKHVLKHGGHEFDMHAVRPKVIEDE